MTLDKLLRKAILVSSLSLFNYNCASTSPEPTSCSKDTDCKGDRICVQGICQPQSTYGGDATGSGTSSSNPCGNSPLYGKHLWEISDCDWGLHFREDCVIGVGWTNTYDYAPQKWGGVSKYSGLEITMPNFPGKPYVLETSPIFQPKFDSETQKIEKVKKKWQN